MKYYYYPCIYPPFIYGMPGSPNYINCCCIYCGPCPFSVGAATPPPFMFIIYYCIIC